MPIKKTAYQQILHCNTGKVYTSAEAAAFVLGIPGNKIRFVCEQYIPNVEGERFEWAKVKPIERPCVENLPRTWLAYRKYKSRRDRHYVKFLLPALQMMISAGTVQGTAADLLESLTSLVNIYHDITWWKTTAGGLSRHLCAWELVYAHLLGMVIDKIRSPQKNRLVLQYTFAPPEDWLQLPYDVDVTKKRFSAQAYPVVSLRTGQVFESLAQAGKYTELSTRHIRYNCDEDLTQIEKGFDISYNFGYLGLMPAYSEQDIALLNSEAIVYYIVDTGMAEEPFAFQFTCADATKLLTLNPKNEETFILQCPTAIQVDGLEFIQQHGEIQKEHLVR